MVRNLPCGIDAQPAARLGARGRTLIVSEHPGAAFGSPWGEVILTDSPHRTVPAAEH